MKTLLVLSLSIFLALRVIAFAQAPATQSSSASSQQQGNETMGQAPSTAAKSNGVKGTISEDGKTLVSDDGKSWTIANPDAVKGHEGHHVELKASTDASAGSIQVTSVKMLKGDKSSMKKDKQQ
jgi:hypothetical protein